MRMGSCFVLLALVFAGCGSAETGPKRYQVAGKVSFDGKPIPAGTIYFETQNGPAGSAQITNGEYDTRKGAGVIGGKHQVLIQGFDGTGTSPGEMGKPIFNAYREDVDLPQEDTTKDFNVPASAAKGLVVSDDPA